MRAAAAATRAGGRRQGLQQSNGAAVPPSARIGAVIPRRANEPQQREFDRVTYRERNLVEWLINRLKQNRAIATRYDKLAVSYHAMLTFACILIWL